MMTRRRRPVYYYIEDIYSYILTEFSIIGAVPPVLYNNNRDPVIKYRLEDKESKKLYSHYNHQLLLDQIIWYIQTRRAVSNVIKEFSLAGNQSI